MHYGLYTEKILSANDSGYRIGICCDSKCQCAESKWTIATSQTLSGAGGKSVYQVMTAKPCHLEVMVGDKALSMVNYPRASTS